MDRIPTTYLKYIEGTDGLFEVRVQLASNIFRIFCFFDNGKLVVLLSGFQKKTQKTPRKGIDKAVSIMKVHYNEKRQIAMGTKTLDQLKDQYYGSVGTESRDNLESELEALRIGF